MTASEQQASAPSSNSDGNDESGPPRRKNDPIAPDHPQAEVAVLHRHLTHELEKARQDKSETAAFWENKYSALNQQFLRTDAELRVRRAEADERDLLRVQLRRAEDEMRSLREQARDEREKMRVQLARAQQDVCVLRGQVREMKTFVSTSTRADGQTSDDVFAHAMTRLANGLQNWVITNFRRAKLVNSTDVEDAAALAEMGRLVPMLERLATPATKIHLFQSLVSKILVDMVFCTYFPGLTDRQTRQFREMETLLASLVASDETVNQWRAFTLALLRRSHGDAHALNDETGSHADSVVSHVRRLLGSITADDATRDFAALRTFAADAVQLARLLGAQKALLQVHMPDILPHQPVPFDPHTMEDVGGEDEEALATKDVWCIVFPGLVKCGDENGSQLQFRNVIVKARVLCNPEG